MFCFLKHSNGIEIYAHQLTSLTRLCNFRCIGIIKSDMSDYRNTNKYHIFSNENRMCQMLKIIKMSYGVVNIVVGSNVLDASAELSAWRKNEFSILYQPNKKFSQEWSTQKSVNIITFGSHRQRWKFF